MIDDLRELERSGSPGLLGQLIDLFLKEADGHLGRLRESLASRDAHQFERAAHTLKGSCGTLGALAMSQRCAELMAVGRSADWSRLAELLPGLEAEYRTVRTDLEAEKRRP